MMTMQDWNDLDTCIAPLRGNKALQQAKLLNEWSQGLDPVHGAFERFMTTFHWSNYVTMGVIFDDLFSQLAFLAGGGTITTIAGSYSYGAGYVPLRTLQGANVILSVGGKRLSGYDKFSSFEHKMPDIECDHEWVEMVYTSFCKHCNATLSKID